MKAWQAAVAVIVFTLAYTCLVPVTFAQTPVTSCAWLGFAAETPENKTEMVLAFEREQASGCGLYFPVTNSPVARLGGAVVKAVSSNGFDAAFLDLLVPSNFGGVEVFPVTLRTRDSDGVIEFRTADTNVFFTLPPTSAASYSSNWIARLHGVPDEPTNGLSCAAIELARRLLLPSHVEITYHFVAESDLLAYDEACQAVWSPQGESGLPVDDEGLRFTTVHVDSNAVHFALAWPNGYLLPGSLVDILCAPQLGSSSVGASTSWQPLAQFPVIPADGVASNAIPVNLIPTNPETVENEGAVTNTVESLYVSGVVYTNIVTPHSPPEACFFMAASLIDADGDGISDALERYVYLSAPDDGDSDDDELNDGYEIAMGWNPNNPDTDGDGLRDGLELTLGFNPYRADSDGNGYSDYMEASWWEAGSAEVPWFDLSAVVPVFQSSTFDDDDVLHSPLPFPAMIGGLTCTNLALDSNGRVFLLTSGTSGGIIADYGNDDLLERNVGKSHFVIAAYWDDLCPAAAPSTSRITVADVTADARRYCVIEYDSMSIYDTFDTRVSFQLAIPQGATNTVYVRYADCVGADGSFATVGAQGLNRAVNLPVAFNEPVLTNGLAIAYHLGFPVSMFQTDTDGDGFCDWDEYRLGLDTSRRDTDGDKLPDKWESDNGFDPTVNNDMDSLDDNGAEDDPDEDGLANFFEYLNGTDPDNPDADEDGTNDGDEVAQVSDPVDASDNGQPPLLEDIKELSFDIYGDFASWEMTVEGLGPEDTRVFKLSTDAPGESGTMTQKLLKGNSYRLTMTWLRSVEGYSYNWYCWSARIDGLPTATTYVDYDSGRLPGVAETVVGDGWFVDNAGGLLTEHVHMNDEEGGNVAGGLDAILYVPKIESINVASAKLGVSPNAPPFPGQTNHVFRPDRSPETDKHAVVLYKDAVDVGFNVQDFDVTLTASLAPAYTPTGGLTFHWEKISGPASGQLLPSSSLSATYRNPKQGGVYRFRLTVRCDGQDMAFGEANLVLPLAGAEMDSVMQSDLVKADAFSAAVTAKYTPKQLQKMQNWRRWFWDEHAGDYTGRPDNDGSPTVWFYNQVNDASGFGAVCTWKGRPVRLTKPSNFILGYAMQKIGTSRTKARMGTGVFNFTETTDKASVGAGWDVADGGNYDTNVYTLVDYIWTHEEENDKSRRVWPNPSAPDNYKGSSTDELFDYNTWYGAPGFLFMTR